MTRVKWSLIFVISLIFLFNACVKREKYPDTPSIDLVHFISVFDSGKYAIRGIMTISFTDGNGDIGYFDRDTISPYDTAGPYYYNYVITFFAKQAGIYHQIDLQPPFSVRIPVLNTEFPGKAITGTITDTLNLSTIPPTMYDTIRFEAFIYDRALNRSNTIQTPEIVLKRP